MRKPSQLYFPLHLAILLTLFDATPGSAQSSPARITDAKQWKKAHLVQLIDRLQTAGLKTTQREEIIKQQAWLKNWEPAQMRAQPKLFQIPARREEPQLQSKKAAELRNQLAANRNATLPSEKLSAQQDASLKTIQKALRDTPDDIALQQMHLHWLDNPIRRKANLQKIDSAAIRLSQLLNPLATENATFQLAHEFVLYRRARALAYCELPDVVEKNPIKDPEKLDQNIRAAFGTLIESAGKGRAEFILLEIRILRREKQFASALELLEKYGSAISPKWYLKKRRDLLAELRWEYPYQEAATIYANEFPQEVASEIARQKKSKPHKPSQTADPKQAPNPR